MIKPSKKIDPENAEAYEKTHPDPITGAPGSHPIGTGVGAAAAGAAGLAVGSIVPGVGTILGGTIGAAIGAIAGGLAGKGLAEAIDPSTENNYWRNEYRNRKYYDSALDYDTDFAPAYRYGWESFVMYNSRPQDEVEEQLRTEWPKKRGTSRLEWDRAQHAVRDAWDRVKNLHSRDRSDSSAGDSISKSHR